MLGLSWVDWLAIVFYLFGITLLGLWATRKVKNSASFFIGDRKFGKLMMMFFTFGSGTHSDQAVTVASKTYNVGASGIWYQWLWLLVTPFYWLIAPIFRRMRAITTADYFEVRYGKSVGGLYAVVGLLNLVVSMGIALKGSGALVAAISGHAIDANYAIVGMTILFLIYGIAGGMSAAIITDFVQGILTIVLSFLILPFAMDAVNGIAGMKETIKDPNMFSLVAPGQITLFYIAVIAINGLIGWVTMPQSMGMSAAGKTEMEGRVGVAGGIMIKRVCTVAWVLIGLCGVAMYARQKIDPDHLYGQIARDLLPKVAPGLIGVMIASMLASVMSSCDTFMVCAAGLFTRNIYKPLFAKDRRDQHYVLVGRASSVVIVILAVFFAINLSGVVKGLEAFWKISAMMGIAFWVGLYWRRATVAGAWAATLTSFAVMLFTDKFSIFGRFEWDFSAHFAEYLPAFVLFEGRLSLPWQMIIYLTAGLMVMVVVSLLTERVSEERLDRVYRNLRTPIQPGEPEVEPFTLPEGVAPGPRKVLVEHPDFEIPVPGAVAVVGFFAAWAAVALLIGGVYWIFSLG